MTRCWQAGHLGSLRVLQGTGSEWVHKEREAPGDPCTTFKRPLPPAAFGFILQQMLDTKP